MCISRESWSRGDAAEPLQDGPGGLGAHAVDGDRGLRRGCAGISEDEARLLRAARLFSDLCVCAAGGCCAVYDTYGFRGGSRSYV